MSTVLEMPALEQLRAEHASSVLAFELANRAYFAASVSDRGAAFFRDFAERYRALVADQDAGAGAYYVLLDDDGTVIGRFNLTFGDGDAAELGYRVAEHVAGRGFATASVRRVCELAAAEHGIRTIRAAASCQNAASRKVLLKAGFVPVGPADPAHLGGQRGVWYQRGTYPGTRAGR